eukprot:5635168-Prymnesium_polylepis.1
MPEPTSPCCRTDGWRRIAIVSEDTVWATSSAAEFERQFLLLDRFPQVLARSVIETSVSGPTSRAAIERVLRPIMVSGASIILVAASSAYQRAIYSYIYETNQLYGAGYAWLSTWISEDMLRNADGSANVSAIRGAEGLLTATQHQDTSSVEFTEYAHLWGERSSSYACQRAQDGKMRNRFCDADGDPTSMPHYALAGVDAVLLYAYAMDRIYQHGANDS